MKNIIVAGLLAAFVTLSVVLEVRLLHPMPGLAQRSDIIHRGEGETRYWLRLSGEPVDVINVNYFGEGINAIDIQRNGAFRKRLWSIDSRFKPVGPEEYDATFR